MKFKINVTAKIDNTSLNNMPVKDLHNVSIFEGEFPIKLNDEKIKKEEY